MEEEWWEMDQKSQGVKKLFTLNETKLKRWGGQSQKVRGRNGDFGHDQYNNESVILKCTIPVA